MNPLTSTRPFAVALLAGALLIGCGSHAAAPSTTSAGSPQSGAVLPAVTNPIVATGTAATLLVESVKVEDNTDAAGKDSPDHLEVALKNTGSTELASVEIYYTFTDTKTSTTESYYLKLPDLFTIAPGALRVAHFDTTGAPDHFAVNKFSVYYTSKNALKVTVVAAAAGTTLQTGTVNKDAGGAEAAD
jgi:hypothetical protein